MSKALQYTIIFYTIYPSLILLFPSPLSDLCGYPRLSRSEHKSHMWSWVYLNLTSSPFVLLLFMKYLQVCPCVCAYDLSGSVDLTGIFSARTTKHTTLNLSSPSIAHPLPQASMLIRSLPLSLSLQHCLINTHLHCRLGKCFAGDFPFKKVFCETFNHPELKGKQAWMVDFFVILQQVTPVQLFELYIAQL